MTKTPDNSLRGIQLFMNLPPEEVSSLESRCKWTLYPAGTQILERESDNRDVYFVVSGSVRIVNYSTSGREIALATIEAGSYFGELSLLNKIPRVATAEVVSDWARIIIVSDTQMRKILAEDHQVSMYFLSNMARKLQLT